jgi:hypothetical protein
MLCDPQTGTLMSRHYRLCVRSRTGSALWCTTRFPLRVRRWRNQCQLNIATSCRHVLFRLLESNASHHGIKALALCNAPPSRVKLSSIFSFFWYSNAFLRASSSAVYRSSTSSSGKTAKFLQSLQPFSVFISLTMLAYNLGWLMRRQRCGFLVSGGEGIIIASILISSSESRRQGGRRAMLVLEDAREEVPLIVVLLLSVRRNWKLLNLARGCESRSEDEARRTGRGAESTGVSALEERKQLKGMTLDISFERCAVVLLTQLAGTVGNKLDRS